jgi:hypothetical protein
MKRIGMIVLCVAILAFFLGRGEKPPAPPAKAGPAVDPVVVPIPAPERPAPEEEAVGLYVHDGDKLRLTLHLLEGGAFTFLAVRPNGESRRASGTWRIRKWELILTYTHSFGVPLPGGPEEAAHGWRGERIELRDPALTGTLTLTKRQTIRLR